MLFNYASATLFLTSPGHVASDLAAATATADSFGLLLVGVNLSAFLLLTASVVMGGRARRRLLLQCKLTLADGSMIQLNPPAARNGHHLFLSHAWRWGQDQAGSLKGNLQALVPDLRTFLDVDSLKDIGQLEAHVRESDVVLVLLTQGYVGSANCRRELAEALRCKKRLLVLKETDSYHGAITYASGQRTLGLSLALRAHLLLAAWVRPALAGGRR